MAKLECALADSLFKPQAEAPLLSIVIPTYQRAAELAQTVASLADQIHDGLEARVEIIISDNGSGPDTVGAIRTLADRHQSVSYVLHARDEGGFFNFLAAPWRARGRYTWVFGSDDVLLEGGLANVVETLEREKVSFVTMNKQVLNADLSQAFWTSTNAVPSRRFDSFIDLFCALGINQFAFISGQIEETEVARALDAEPFLRTSSRHPHVAAYLAKHAQRPAYYSAGNHLVHRNNNSPLHHYNAGNFFDYGTTLPLLLTEVGRQVGAPDDLLERITGYKRIANYDPPDVTFVDAMMENLLRAMAFGFYMNTGHRRALEQILGEHGRSDRLAQLEQIWSYGLHLSNLEQAEARSRDLLKSARDAALETSAIFTRSTKD
jgi:glycosyltransferase involved in cell wall biosynthesis